MNLQALRTIAGDIAIATVFFTRLPLPSFAIAGRKLGDAIWAAPIAGLVLALLGSLISWLLGLFDVPNLPAAAIVLVAIMLASGCLHEDGLADVADGFGGGKTIDRKLEIMHDSRLGTYGAAALLGSVIIRWGALATLAGHDAIIPALIAAHVGSRAIFARLMRDTPLAAQAGLAATVGAITETSAMASLALGLAGLFFLGVFGGLVTAIVVAGAVLAFRQICMRQIGGLTGDTLGAAQQIAEIVILVAASAILT